MNKLLIGILIPIFLGVSAEAQAGSSFWWKPKKCMSQSVDSVPLVEQDAGGYARLCIPAGSVSATMTLTGLVPGNAYTTWWVYVDDPGSCLGTSPLPVPFTTGDSPCDFDDFVGDKPLVSFGRMASGVSPRRGRLHMAGTFGGMQPSPGSEIWLFSFGHGPANLSDGDALARQLLTPEDPGAGAPHLGNLVDGLRGYPISVAVFKVD